MPLELILAGAATVGGALISSSASGKAAEAQVTGSESAILESRRQYDLSRGDILAAEGRAREDIAPWFETGTAALSQYSGLMGVGGDAPDTAGMNQALRGYPGYQFALEEGVGAIEKSAAARGLTQSGQTLKDLTRYGQGLATTNFENYMSRLQGLSGGGQRTAAQSGAISTASAARTGTLGAESSRQIGASQRQVAEARATGYQNRATAWGGAIEGIAGLGGEYIGGL